jgi:class 3 adenylate cyclase/tetratricopeptide (TPR) repeat protein
VSPAELRAALAAIEAQRALLGDAATDAAAAALAEKIERLATDEAAQQLKQVSLLFTDVVGSTTLSQRLDPEQINALMDGALARFTRIVEAHGGRVLQYAGDNVLAVFGAPVAHEDDAERAVHAALAITAAGRELGAEVAERHAFDGFDVRVGVHTGGVLLGGGVDGEHSVRGIAVNIAARMEQTAPPGRVRISVDTWRAVRGRFEVEEQPPLSVKGVDEPLRTFLVHGLVAESDWAALRGVDGVHTPLVGREAELAALAQEIGALAGLRLVTVVAEAGLGKSRLAAELRQRVAGVWHDAHAGEQARARPYGVLAQWLAVGLAGLDSDAPERARERWLAAASPRLASEADAAVLGHLIGIDFSSHAEVKPLATDPRQLRDRAFFHATQWLEAAAPRVLLLDDAHWADEGSLDFLEHLAAARPEMPLLVLALARPTLYERRPGWGAAFAAARRIDLAPLDAEQSRALADALLDRLPELPPALRSTLVERAEGNPFYMEEWVNMLIDRGVIVVEGDGAWRFVAARYAAMPLPTTLVAVLQARLDALREDARRTAQLASVVGFRFWDDSLAALGAPLPEGLQALIDHEVARAEAVSRLAGLHEFAFRHHLPYQVIYDSVLKRVRTGLHGKVARWLAAQPGEPPQELIAEHYERGGEGAEALGWWQRAAEAAAVRYANEAALAHIERAFALAPAADLARRHALQLLRCKVLEVASAGDRLGPELDALHALAVQLGDAERQSEALRRAGRHRFDSGDIDAALAFAQRAFDAAPAAAAARRGNARALVAQCLARLGRREEARRASEEALALALAAGDAATAAMVHNDMGVRADDEGDYGRALAHYEQALAGHRRSGDRRNEGGTLVNIAYAALMVGRAGDAAAGFEQAIALFRRIGMRQNIGITLINLAMAELQLARAPAALQHAQEAATLLAAVRDRWDEAAAHRVHGRAALALGRTDEAEGSLRTACEMLEGMGLPGAALEARCGLAEAALARGDGAAARSEVERVLAHPGSPWELAEEPLRMQWVCWRVLDSAGDARAPDLLATARRTLHERAARIGDAAARAHYLEAVPVHRELSGATG